MQNPNISKAKTITTQDGEVLKIEYQIIIDETDDVSSYGIAISSYNKSNVLNEFVEIKDITQNFIEIQALIMVLYKHEVTPIALHDVLDDYLANFGSFAAI